MSVTFFVDEQRFDLTDSSVNLGTSLAQFLRERTTIKSVKIGCGEGGCGACAVWIERFDPVTGEVEGRTENGCVIAVGMLDGCRVLTTAGLGCKLKGFSHIQETLIKNHGSQCGYCSPGMVVACYGAAVAARSRAAAGKLMSEEQMERSLDGNLCRCTGYRPILDTIRSLQPSALIGDMEDMCAAAPGAFPVELRQGKPGATLKEALTPGSCDGTGWWMPSSLAAVHDVMLAATKSGLQPRLVAGNTGAAVFKNWPTAERCVIYLSRVRELQGIREEAATGGKITALWLGACVTMSQLNQRLQYLMDALEGQEGEKQGLHGGYHRMVQHLQRIAGTHVRNAATVGGNIWLSRYQDLPSDLCVILLALSCQVCFGSSTRQRTVDLQHFLSKDGTGFDPFELGPDVVLEGIRMPLLTERDHFWSTKVAALDSNAHAEVNLAVHIRRSSSTTSWTSPGSIQDAAVAVGYPGPPQRGDGVAEPRWTITRLAAAEQLLMQQASLSVEVLERMMQLLPCQLHPSSHAAPYLQAAAPALLFRALAPLCGVQHSEEQMQIDFRHHGSQSAPQPLKQQEPVTAPVPKYQGMLQASGEAQYTADVPVQGGALYGVFVRAKRNCVRLKSVDTAAAVKLPGFVTYLCAADIPEKGRNHIAKLCNNLGCPDMEPLFVEGKVQYHGQPVGMVLATSEVEARAAAAAVQITYDEDSVQEQPIISIEQAIARDSFHVVWTNPSTTVCRMSFGAAEDVLRAAPQSHQIHGKVSVPSQQHMYLEPMAAMAERTEEGVHVHMGTQSHQVGAAVVANALGLPVSCVRVTTRRAGGGFGGKLTRILPSAVSAALGAYKTGRQVRVVLDRNTDLELVGGRPQYKSLYSLVLDGPVQDASRTRPPRLLAVKVQTVMQCGWYPDMDIVEESSFTSMLASCYDIPNVLVECRAARCNLPCRTAVRSPGLMQACHTIEHILDHIAGATRTDPVALREASFVQLPPRSSAPVQDHAENGQALRGAAGSHADADCTSANGRAVGDREANGHGEAQQVEKGSKLGEGGEGEDKRVVKLVSGTVPADMYTLPRLWADLEERCGGFKERAAAVHSFNRSHRWLKRGLSIVPATYPLQGIPMPALVSIQSDGSVNVAYSGQEIGQGLSTKVLQVAARTMAQAMESHGPEAVRQLATELLPLVHLNNGNTQYFPHTAYTGGSSTSESTCEAVRLACCQLVERLKPVVEKQGARACWKDVVHSLTPMQGLLGISTQLLTATAFYGGTNADSTGPLSYTAFGVGCVEAEVDVLTGAHRVVRADIVQDVGRSINPATDIGQVEGAFVMGLGVLLTEDVELHPHSGALLSNSTWSYKAPAYSTVPEIFNVHLLQHSNNRKGLFGSKAVGEPPLLLSYAAFAALRRAVEASREDLQSWRSAQVDASDDALYSEDVSRWEPGAVDLMAPATPARVRLACGPLSPLQLLHP